jgi:Arc/MetJ-type ribon-helix-helix transcriptional regulator
MSRIDLNKPYVDFLQSQVNAGLFRSITSAAEDAIRQQMLLNEKRRIESVLLEIKIGENDVKAGNMENFDLEFISNLLKESKL